MSRGRYAETCVPGPDLDSQNFGEALELYESPLASDDCLLAALNRSSDSSFFPLSWRGGGRSTPGCNRRVSPDVEISCHLSPSMFGRKPCGLGLNTMFEEEVRVSTTKGQVAKQNYLHPKTMGRSEEPEKLGMLSLSSWASTCRTFFWASAGFRLSQTCNRSRNAGNVCTRLRFLRESFTCRAFISSLPAWLLLGNMLHVCLLWFRGGNPTT